MITEVVDKTLEELSSEEFLSVRTINICRYAELTNLSLILKYYNAKGSFLHIKNCGRKSNKELIDLCEKHNALSSITADNLIMNISDIPLDILAKENSMEIRTVNVCKENKLKSLKSILNYYKINKGFERMKNCGLKTQNDLKRIYDKYEEFLMDNEDFPNQKHNEEVAKTIERLNPFQRELLNQHFDFLVSKLSVRAHNGLAGISSEINLKVIIEKIFADQFSFLNIPNVGKKSFEELEAFKTEINRFIALLKNTPIENLNKEYYRIIIKRATRDLNNEFDKLYDSIFDVNGKIKVFKLIDILRISSNILGKQQKVLFEFTFTNRYSDNKTNLNSMASELKVTKERVRQLLAEFNIEKYYGFITSFNPNDFVNYEVNNLQPIYIINKEFAKRININEETDFNVLLYASILGMIIKKTHYILGDNEVIYGKRKTKNQKIFNNCYLIKLELIEIFDFDKFVEDIYLKLNDKNTETYFLHFKGYLYNYFKNDSKEWFEEISKICDTILFNEFELVVNTEGYITFERNSIKKIQEYCYNVLEDESKPMGLVEIKNSINEKYPFLNLTTGQIRSSLIRERNTFISFGRSSTYGLRKWEAEKDNLRGGTIRDIVEEYLDKQNTPQHILDITDYVKKFRSDTYSRSITDNLKAESTKFVFYSGNFIGLKSKRNHYDTTDFKKLGGAAFSLRALKKYVNWDIDELVSHYAAKYKCLPVQVLHVLNKKIDDGTIILLNNKIILNE